MGLQVVEIVKGVFRKVGILEGATKPMGKVNTTVPAWLTTPPYDPLSGEVLLGLDGPERVLLGADGKLYPPLVSGGLPPGVTIGPGTEFWIATNSDTLFPMATYAGNAGIRLFAVYQSSGGAVAFLVCSGDGTTMFSQSIASGVMVTLNIYPITLSSTISVKWAAAAGATQFVVYQPQKLIPVR